MLHVRVSAARALAALALAALLAAPALAPAAAPAVARAEGGLAWSNEHSPAGGPVQSVGGSASVLVASTWSEGAFRSTDGGRDWQRIADFPEVVEARVVWDPLDAARGFVAGFGGVARTEDGGATWALVLDTFVSYRMAISPGGRIAASFREADDTTTMRVSDDGGDTWAAHGTPLGSFASLQGLAFGRTEDELVMATLTKIYRSTDAGATWTELPANVILDLVRTGDGALWRAGAPLQRSTDGGLTWADVETPGEANPGLLGPIPGGLLAASAEGLYRTTDGGATWEELGFPGVAFASTSLVADPADAEAFFVSHEALGVVWVGPDGQGGWRAEGRTGGFPPVDVFALGRSHDGSLLLAGGPLGLYASRDGGLRWEHTGAAIGLTTVWATAANGDGGVVYAGGQNAIFQNFLLTSRDGGRTWEHHGFDVGGDSRVVGIATHPTEPGSAWVAVQPEFGGGQVFETRDAGRTFASVLPPLEAEVFAVAFDGPTGAVLVATELGLYVRDALGLWTARTLGEGRAVAADGGVAYGSGEVASVWRSVPLPAGPVLLPWADPGAPTHLAASPGGAEAWATVGNRLQRCVVPGLCAAESPDATVVQAMLRPDGARVFAAAYGAAKGVWSAEL